MKYLISAKCMCLLLLVSFSLFAYPALAQSPTSHSRSPFHRYSSMKGEAANPDNNSLTTVQHWNGQIFFQGISYPYSMVGTDPRLGSATTVIPTLIIPLRFVFADGSVVDAGSDLIDGQTAIHGILNSPIFQPYPFTSGGTKVGNTRYPDAFQRANFWNYVSTKSKDYHVLLGKPTVLATQAINVPADKGGYEVDTFFGSDTIYPFVDTAFLDQQVKALIVSLGISPQSLPIFVTGTAWPEEFAVSYHSASNALGKPGAVAGAQTWIVASYQRQSSFNGFLPDVSSLSHEVNEWLDDPFVNNYSPGWNFVGDFFAQCDSYFTDDLLEVCDPLEFSPGTTHSLPSNSFTYHVDDSCFLDFYTRSPHSNSVNGQYSFFGGATSPTSTCTAHLQIDYNFVSVPGSTATFLIGMNNLGQVVGFYYDSAGQGHGFLSNGKQFTTIDPPGATFTELASVNDAGVVGGEYAGTDGIYHGFSYQNGKFTRIDFPNSTGTFVSSVNLFGDVVGSYFDASGFEHGFILSHGHYQTADAPNAVNTYLGFENNLRQIVGGAFTDPVNGPVLGFLQNGKNYTSIRFPDAFSTEPSCINNLGMTVGFFINDNGYADGFVTVYGFPYEIFGGASGINDLGQICGYVINTDGVLVGFTAQLPLQPTKP